MARNQAAVEVIAAAGGVANGNGDGLAGEKLFGGLRQRNVCREPGGSGSDSE